MTFEQNQRIFTRIRIGVESGNFSWNQNQQIYKMLESESGCTPKLRITGHKVVLNIAPLAILIIKSQSLCLLFYLTFFTLLGGAVLMQTAVNGTKNIPPGTFCLIILQPDRLLNILRRFLTKWS